MKSTKAPNITKEITEFLFSRKSSNWNCSIEDVFFEQKGNKIKNRASTLLQPPFLVVQSLVNITLSPYSSRIVNKVGYSTRKLKINK